MSKHCRNFFFTLTRSGLPVTFLFILSQVDLLYMQSLRGIRDIHESGVDEQTFSEVKCLQYI